MDGVERIVVRSVCSNIHSVSGDQLAMTPETQRFSLSTGLGASLCGCGVYNHIKDGYFNNSVSTV